MMDIDDPLISQNPATTGETLAIEDPATPQVSLLTGEMMETNDPYNAENCQATDKPPTSVPTTQILSVLVIEPTPDSLPLTSLNQSDLFALATIAQGSLNTAPDPPNGLPTTIEQEEVDD
jgi:hypothetical protein